MMKWMVVITNENGVLNRITFDNAKDLQTGMKAVVEASQTWDWERFKAWSRNAKAGQWVEMRDFRNRIRALVVRLSDPKGWYKGE